MAEAPVTNTLRGTNSANMYIDINKQGTGTLSGDDVDPKLVKAERLVQFKEKMHREFNPASESTMFSAGQIHASWVLCKILRTQVSIYVQESFNKATSIPSITVFRSDIISGKYTVTEQIDYKDCYITQWEESVDTLEGGNLSFLTFQFRFSQRQDTLFDFDQNSQPLGQQVAFIDFTKGTLKPQGGDGGGGGGGGGEGGVPG